MSDSRLGARRKERKSDYTLFAAEAGYFEIRVCSPNESRHFSKVLKEGLLFPEDGQVEKHTVVEENPIRESCSEDKSRCFSGTINRAFNE